MGKSIKFFKLLFIFGFILAAKSVVAAQNINISENYSDIVSRFKLELIDIDEYGDLYKVSETVSFLGDLPLGDYKFEPPVLEFAKTGELCSIAFRRVLDNTPSLAIDSDTNIIKIKNMITMRYLEPIVDKKANIFYWNANKDFSRIELSKASYDGSILIMLDLWTKHASQCKLEQ